MSELKEMSLEDYNYLPPFIITTSTNKETQQQIKTNEYPKPIIGKLYRNPIVHITTSRTVTIEIIIGIEKQAVPHFEYAYPHRVKRLHIEERKIYVKTT